MQTQVLPLRLPSMILFGCGAAEKIADEAKALKAKNVLIICDPGIAATGMVGEIKSLMEKAGLSVGVFSDVIPEPPAESLEPCVQMAREGHFDLVVGLGGGSSMDAAKVVAVLAVHPGKVEDLFAPDSIPGRGLPTIMMPTTAGTGSEATINSILTDTKNHVKKGIVSRFFMPDVAIVDPLLTLSCPPKVSAASGMDTLTHAIESYVSVKATLHTRLYAMEAVKLCAAHLRTAVLNGANVAGREGMARASLYAGISISNAGTAASGTYYATATVGGSTVASDATVVTVLSEGSSCSDGNACTSADACTAGACAGVPVTGPPEVERGVRVDRNGTDAAIAWNPAAGAASSSVLRGLVSALPVGSSPGNEICLASRVPVPTSSVTDTGVPPLGNGFWYLVRGESACGAGPYGYEGQNGAPTVPEVSAACP